jgi:hypothetical protein
MDDDINPFWEGDTFQGAARSRKISQPALPAVRVGANLEISGRRSVPIDEEPPTIEILPFG